MPEAFDLTRIGLKQDDYDSYVASVPTTESKLDRLSTAKETKLGNLAGYDPKKYMTDGSLGKGTTEEGLWLQNKVLNEYNPAELQYLQGRTYQELGVVPTEQGYMTRDTSGELAPFAGAEGDLASYYGFGTKGSEDIKKAGKWAGGVTPEDRYTGITSDVDKYGKPIGPEGVDISDREMNLLYPRGVDTLMEGLQHGNKYALEGRADAGDTGFRDRFGTGSTEAYKGGWTGAFGGDSREFEIADKEGLWKEFSSKYGLDALKQQAPSVEVAPVQDVDELLKQREGFVSGTYLDTLGNPTAGFGHLLSEDERKKYPVGTEIPQEQLDAWYKEDSAEAKEAAKGQLKELGLDDSAYATLTSMNYQLGTNWTEEWPETVQAIKEGDYDKAVSNIASSKWMQQTPERANDAIAMLRGTTSSTLPVSTSTAGGKGYEAIAARLIAESRAEEEANRGPVGTFVHEAMQMAPAAVTALASGSVELLDAIENGVLSTADLVGAETETEGFLNKEDKEAFKQWTADKTGYDRAADQALVKSFEDKFVAMGADLSDPDSLLRVMSDPKNALAVAGMVKETIQNPSLIVNSVGEYVGSGLGLKLLAKAGMLAVGKASPKAKDAIENFFERDKTKVLTERNRIQSSNIPESEKIAALKELKGEYGLLSKAKDFIKGDPMMNADLAIRMNNDIEEFIASNDGEEPTAGKLLSMFAANKLVSSMEGMSLKYIAGVGKIVPDTVRESLAGKVATVVGSLASKGLVEGGQETIDGLVQNINQKFGSADYEGVTLEDIIKESTAEILTGTVIGTGAGVGIGAAGEAVSLARGTGEVAAKGVEAVKKVTAKEEPVEVSEEEANNSLRYRYNKLVLEGNKQATDNVASMVKDTIATEDFKKSLSEGDYETGIARVKDIANLLGYNNEFDDAELGGFITNVAEGLGVPKEVVESQASVEYEKGKILAAVEKNSSEIANLYRQAENLFRLGKTDELAPLVGSLRTNPAVKANPEFAEMVDNLAINLPKEKEVVTKEAISDLSDRALSNVKKEQVVKELIKTSEDSKYKFGSSAEALDVIDSLLASGGVGKSRVDATIDRIADNNDISKDVIEAMRKSYTEVEAEATTGERGYLVYGNMLKSLEGDAKEAVLDKARRFYTSQNRASKALEDMLNRANEVTKPGTKVESDYLKADGSKFDILIGKDGKPVPSQVAKTEQLIALKKANMKGIEESIKEALGTTVTEPEVASIPIEPTVEEVKPVEAPKELVEEVKVDPVKEVEKVAVEVVPERKERRAGGTSSQLDAVGKDLRGKRERRATVTEEAKKTTVEKEAPSERDIAIDAVKYVIGALNSGETKEDITKGLMVKGLSKEQADKFYAVGAKEEVEVVVTPKEQVTKVIKNNLYKDKGSYLVNSLGNPEFNVNDKTRVRSLAEIQRNLNDYVKVGRDTTLNTMPIDSMGSKVRKIVDSSVELLSNIISKPTSMETTAKTQTGLETAQSPSRAMIFNADKSINEVVALALRAALVESVSYDDVMFSKTWKTKDDVARMLGRDGPNDVSYELWSLVKDKGVMYDTIANSLGAKVTSLLGISEKSTSTDVQNFARLQADLGAAAIHMGISEGMLEFTKGDDGKDGIPGKEFFSALEEEASTEGARINFISFVNETDAMNKLNSDRANILSEAIPELGSDRDAPYLEGVPKEVVNKRLNNIHNDTLGIKPSKTHKKVLKKLMDTEWSLDRGLALEVLANKDAVLKSAGYVNEDSPEFDLLSYDSKESQKGKNRKALEDMQALEDMVKAGEAGKDTSLWYEWYVTKNQRFMMASNTVSPMNEKQYHRWIVQPKEMKLNYIVSKVGRGFKAEVNGKNTINEVRYALGQGLGLAVDKVSTKNIKDFGNAVLNMEVEQLNDMKKELLAGNEYSINDKFTAEVEHIGQMLLAVDFLIKAKEGKPFSSSLSAEFDAVTSGFGLKLMQMPILGKLNDYLKKVGISLPSKMGKNPASMNDLIAKKGFLDSYKTLASEVDVKSKYKNFISIKEDLADKFDKGSKKAREVLEVTKDGLNRSMWASLKAVLPETGTDTVSNEMRALFKDPFMTFNYSRSIGNIKQGLAGNIVSGLVDKMITNKNGKYDSLLRGLAMATQGSSQPNAIANTVKMLKEKPTEDIKLAGSNVTIKEYLESFVVATYGAEVDRVFNEEFGEFIAAQEDITNAFKYAFEVFDVMYEDKVDRFRKLNNRLNTEDKKSIINDLMEVFPLISGPASEEFKTNFEYRYLTAKDGEVAPGFTDGSIAIFKDKNVASGSDVLQTSFKTAEGIKNRNLNPKVKGVTSTGVAGTVLPIHAIDAYILAQTYLNGESMQIIHDAIIPKLDVAMESVKEYNKQVNEANRNYSFVSGVNEMVNRVTYAIKDVDESLLDKIHSKVITRKPVGWDKDTDFTVRDLERITLVTIQDLNNRVQNGRAELFNSVDEDPDARIMHMAGLEEGTYTTKEQKEIDLKDQEEATAAEATEVFSDKLNSLIDEMLNCK